MLDCFEQTEYPEDIVKYISEIQRVLQLKTINSKHFEKLQNMSAILLDKYKQKSPVEQSTGLFCYLTISKLGVVVSPSDCGSCGCACSCIFLINGLAIFAGSSCKPAKIAFASATVKVKFNSIFSILIYFIGHAPVEQSSPTISSKLLALSRLIGFRL